MIGAIIFAAYAAISLAVMRYAYVRLRTHDIEEIAEETARHHYLTAARTYDTETRLFNGFVGVFIGLLWPLGALILAITHNPPKSAAELHQEAKEREEYIRKLERELGIGGD